MRDSWCTHQAVLREIIIAAGCWVKSLEVVFATPAGSIRLSPDRRLPNFLSLIRAAAGALSTRTPCSLAPSVLGAAVASVSPGSQCAQSREKPTGLPSCRPCRSNGKAGLSSGQAQRRTFTGGEVRSGTAENVEVLSGGGSGWEELQRRGTHAWCNAFYAPVTNALEFSLRHTRRECGKTGWLFSVSTGAGSNLRVTIAGTSEPYEASLYGPSVQRRERHRKIRTPACCAVPNFRSTWPRSGRKFAAVRTDRPQRSPKRPLVARRSFSCRRLTQRSGCAEDGEEAADGAHLMERSKTRARIAPVTNHHDDNLGKQARTSVKHGLQAEQLGQRGRGAKSNDGEACWDKVAIFLMLAQVSFAIVHDASRQFRVGDLSSLHYFLLFHAKQSS